LLPVRCLKHLAGLEPFPIPAPESEVISMIHQLLTWLGIDRRSGQVRLHQELAAIELTLALRN
jgi:hypothetical protein